MTREKRIKILETIIKNNERIEKSGWLPEQLKDSFSKTSESVKQSLKELKEED